MVSHVFLQFIKFATNANAESMFSLPYFEHQLVMYVTSDDKSTWETPFDISKIPIVTREQADAEDRTKKLTATAPTLKAPKVGPTKAAPTSGAEAAASATAQAQRYSQELMEIPEMAAFGSVLKSSPVIELTEAETEYVVTLVKHIFKEHIVLQYEVKNTLPDTVLENVSILASPVDEEELEEAFIIPADKLVTDEPGKIYVAFSKVNGEASLPITSFSNILKFTTKEVDPSTGEPEETGYDDEYEISEFDLAGSDYIVPTFASNFSDLWERIGAAGEEAEETLQLSGMKSIAGEQRRKDRIACVWYTDMRYRGNGAAGNGSVLATIGGYRCSRQHKHAYPQATWQERRWRQGGCERADGILIQVWRHNKDHGEERRGKCSGFGHCVCGIKAGQLALMVVNMMSSSEAQPLTTRIMMIPTSPFRAD